MAESLLQELKSKYLASVKNAFQHIEDNDSHVGKIVCPDQMYPRLRLLRVPRKEEDSIPYSGSLLENVEVTRSSDRYSPTNVKDLFVPDRDGFVPKIAVLVGPPGVGKTVNSQKIMLDWASGKLYTDQFNVVFYLSGRAINKIAGNVNISDLVAQSSAKLHCPENLIKSAFNDSSKVLIIIDGFDELRWTLENDYEDYDDPFLKIHKETFLRCLIEKEMLSEASLLITTRSMFLRKLKDFTESSSSVELLGFSERDLEIYFHHFFKNEEDVHQAISVLKENEVLLSLCSIPLTCWLVCAILKAGMKNELRSSKCKTLTTVYLLYLKSLLTNQGSHQLVLKCLKKLCVLANEGILNQKSLFEVNDLERHELTIFEVTSVFPNNSIFQREVEASTNFSFIHLSIQEFFAALYYVLGEDAEVKETNGSGGNTYLPKVCKGKSLFYQSKHHPSLNSTVRFLFGLLNDKHLKEFAAALGFSASLRAKSAMEKWLTAEKRSGFCVEAVTCFYEAQDEELRSGAFSAQDLLFQACLYASAMESVPIREMLYCLADRTSFGSICLEDYLMRPKVLELLAPFFHGASKLSFTRCGFADDFTTGEHASFLANPDSKIKELEIHVCVVTPSFYDDLRSFISSSRSLNKLTVSHQILEDSAMKKLCDGLQQPDCTLQELILEDCNLAASSCEILGAALKANRSLLKLDLTLNKIEDEGMKFLCEALRDPACIMRELRIEFAELTSACCEHLRSALMTNRNLNTLYMRECNLQDAGVKLLCEALRQPHCTVKELRLYENNLSGAICEDFRSVLLTNRTLTRLNLTYNDLGDSGVKLLCEGLCDPGCTLQELVLIHCELTPLSCKDLSSALIKSRSLTSLDVTWNNLQDSGVTVLSEGLRDPNCILKELRMSGCDMSDLALKEFSTVIGTNRSLTNLDLSGNNKYRGSGVDTICKALRNPTCALQEFRMGYCEMTPTCAEDLLAMIDTNKSLNELEVSFAYEDEAPPADLDEMCRKFEHPSCTLEKNDTQDGLFIYFKYKKQK